LLLKTSFKLQNRQQLTSGETLLELVYIRQKWIFHDKQSSGIVLKTTEWLLKHLTSE